MYEQLDVDKATEQGPAMLDSVTELPRAMQEAALLSASWYSLLRTVPRGKSLPVMVLPGFGGGDDSTALLRRFLTRLRYKTFPWQQGTNTGNPNQLEALMLRFYRIHHGLGTPLILIGQSLGGVYAREIAREFPDAVRSVVTLGSPYAATGAESASPMVAALFERMSGVSIEELRDQRPADRPQTPLTMPATSVYSKQDGVVAWQTCIEPESELSENIRVWGSHTGMAMNTSIFHIVADRLAQDPENWRKFEADGVRRLMFPCGSGS